MRLIHEMWCLKPVRLFCESCWIRLFEILGDLWVVDPFGEEWRVFYVEGTQNDTLAGTEHDALSCFIGHERYLALVVKERITEQKTRCSAEVS